MLDFSLYLNSISGAVNQWADYLVSQGLSKSISRTMAGFYLLLNAYGMRPVITSIYRSPEKQAAMREAWLRGDRQGLRYLPAKNSDHCHETTNWLGMRVPASLAMDIDLGTRQYSQAAMVAHAMGIKTGYEIGDEVHYFYK